MKRSSKEDSGAPDPAATTSQWGGTLPRRAKNHPTPEARTLPPRAKKRLVRTERQAEAIRRSRTLSNSIAVLCIGQVTHNHATFPKTSDARPHPRDRGFL